MAQSTLRILVLAGGPDQERPVSLNSGAAVTQALREAGHDVQQHDIHPDDLSALDAFEAWPGDVIFPVLHGKWGEGGGLQALLDERGLPYVGSRAPAASRCMDKARTKAALIAAGLPTPAFEMIGPGETPHLAPPVVVKPPDEGSSLGLVICPDAPALAAARRELSGRYPRLMVEQYIAGRELTVGILGHLNSREATPPTHRALPPIQIVPATEFYDYQAKYDRDDTQYLFEIDLPTAVLEQVQAQALAAHDALGGRHLSRVDFMVDADGQPWILEINTLPGFTSHSLLPMAAKRAGMSMPTLTDHLARLALREYRNRSSRSKR